MERLSIFDIFKIGIGPSSSHTMGPWKAAAAFTTELYPQMPDKIEVHLYGSLSKTGKGHATDLAVQLGLEGYNPRTINLDALDDRIQAIKAEHMIRINNNYLSFNPDENIVFHSTTDARHPNTLILKAFKEGECILESCYFSIGGGFIEKEGIVHSNFEEIKLPHPIDSGDDLGRYAESHQLSISEIVYKNELAFRNESDVKNEIRLIYNTMVESVYKGCHREGYLPGGLHVKRRAHDISKNLLDGVEIDEIEDWLSAVSNSHPTFKMLRNG